jgi:hypothetical protein
MTWDVPENAPRIPTFRVLNEKNRIENHITAEIPTSEVLKWYKNMLTGNPPSHNRNSLGTN